MDGIHRFQIRYRLGQRGDKHEGRTPEQTPQKTTKRFHKRKCVSTTSKSRRVTLRLQWTTELATLPACSISTSPTFQNLLTSETHEQGRTLDEGIFENCGSEENGLRHNRNIIHGGDLQLEAKWNRYAGSRLGHLVNRYDINVYKESSTLAASMSFQWNDNTMDVQFLVDRPARIYSFVKESAKASKKGTARRTKTQPIMAFSL
jgi:hypothetical protein